MGSDADFNDALCQSTIDFYESVNDLLGVAALPTVRPHDSFVTLLELMVTTAAPSLYVVEDDEDGVPRCIGVITQLDIITAVRPPLGGL